MTTPIPTPDGDVTRLPRWAQRHIAALTDRVTEDARRIDTLTGDATAHYDRIDVVSGTYGETPMPLSGDNRPVRMYLDGLDWRDTSVDRARVDIRPRDGYIEAYCDRPIGIQAPSSNIILLHPLGHDDVLPGR